jgi:predicted transcriptional regulator
MAIVTVRVDSELKNRMDRFRHINWSEVIRRAIIERIALEEALTSSRVIDVKRLEEAIIDQDRLRSKTTGRWLGAEEIRKWRDLRR